MLLTRSVGIWLPRRSFSQEELEGMLPTVAERQYLQCHPATADLMRRFNLPIYFQLRVQV